MGILAHGVLALIKKKAGLLAVVFAFAVISGALVWSSFSGFWKTNKAQPAEQQTANNNQQTALANDAGKDSDDDGLKDWEEGLYGTDPKKADTDGDKTPDGEEIRLGRDPLKKWPDDKVREPTVDAATNGERQTADTGNLTYNLTKSILESGVLGAIDQSGNLASTDFLQNINLPDNIDPEILFQSTPFITKSNLPTAAGNDPQAVIKYFDSLSAVYQKDYVPQSKISDLFVLVTAMQSENYAKLAELDPLIRALKLTITDAKKIPVPPDYKDFAAREINYLIRTERMIEIFRNTESDPLATAVIFKKRIELMQEIAEFHLATRKELDAKGIKSASAQ